MNAMIFAAGLGTRLQPLTNNVPKALVYVNKQTMLERCILFLADKGVSKMVINIHHHAEKIVQFIENHGYFGLDIYFSDERAELLDTGGGLLKAEKFLKEEEDFIAINVDVLSNIDLNKMIEFHKSNKALVTLAVRNRPESSRQLLFDDSGFLKGRKNKKTNESILLENNTELTELAFSGIHIINKEWFQLQTLSGNFSIIESYLELAKTQKIIAFRHDEDYWFDLGSEEKIKEAEFYLTR
jgi:MurNAc alpha-1-phosphate uridylyltransferase